VREREKIYIDIDIDIDWVRKRETCRSIQK
jgi:hypothetical protein